VTKYVKHAATAAATRTAGTANCKLVIMRLQPALVAGDNIIRNRVSVVADPNLSGGFCTRPGADELSSLHYSLTMMYEGRPTAVWHALTATH